MDQHLRKVGPVRLVVREIEDELNRAADALGVGGDEKQPLSDFNIGGDSCPKIVRAVLSERVHESDGSPALDAVHQHLGQLAELRVSHGVQALQFPLGRGHVCRVPFESDGRQIGVYGGVNVVIREGNSGDAGAIAAIRERTIRAVVAPLGLYTPVEIEAWVTGFDADRVLQLMVRGRYLVADDAGRVVGFGRLEVASPGRGVIRGIFVDADCVGRGIGAAIVRGLLELGRSQGVRSFELVATLNARGFYERLGFHSLGRVSHTTVNGATIPGYRMEREPEKH